MSQATSISVHVPLNIRRRGGRKVVIAPDGSVLPQARSSLVPVEFGTTQMDSMNAPVPASRCLCHAIICWSAMYVTAALHLMRVFVTGSYKRPREGNWLIGVAMFGLVLLAVFTGNHLTTERVRQELHAVADSQDRHSKFQHDTRNTGHVLTPVTDTGACP